MKGYERQRCAQGDFSTRFRRKHHIGYLDGDVWTRAGCRDCALCTNSDRLATGCGGSAIVRAITLFALVPVPYPSTSNGTAVVVTRMNSIYHCWWARLDCFRIGRYNDHLKHSAGKNRSIREWQPFLPRATRFELCGQVRINVPPGSLACRPNLTYKHTVRYAIAPSTTQTVNVGLAQARPN